LKKANVYYFDEPSSYLDISQRLKIAKFIRNLVKEDTAVLVIEHDLIILDYMTDLIHIMYGKSGCFGVVSNPNTTKEGINIYLSGYLRTENVRFRDKKIEFLKKAAERVKQKELLVRWPELGKKLGKFSLDVKEGEINKNEVVGVLGKNAIGKTTFVKILAGLIKSDLKLKLKISYKPQYLESDSKELVSKVLKEAVKKYKVELIKNLEIDDLLLKKINELSGGELQRVSIALALSKTADLVLLDEPSAYLDVEQRLNVARVINDFIEKNEVSALVVDHDLLFLDYLSRCLLVFEGEAAVKGIASGPFSMEKGMNKLLEGLSITLRRDTESGRPRINKPDSVKDREQRTSGKLYYT
jgi:ATP-binding cassette subfamily E protein 1